MNAGASVEDYMDNPKTVIILRKRRLVKQTMEALKIERNKTFHDKLYAYHLRTFETGDVENEFEDLDTYFRIYIFKHIGKASQCQKVFNVLENLFCVKNLYKQILYHRSYHRFRLKLADLIDSPHLDHDEKSQLI